MPEFFIDLERGLKLPDQATDPVSGLVAGLHYYNTTSNDTRYYNGTSWVILRPSLETKSGIVLNAAFSGNPKKATVTFSSAFSDANYSVSLVCTTVSNSSYTPVIESLTSSGFVINTIVNNITNLTDVRWVATKNGSN